MDDIKNVVLNKVRKSDNNIVIRSYIVVEHPYELTFNRRFDGFSDKLNISLPEIKQINGNFRHLAVFENELKAPSEISLLNNNFDEWIEKNKIDDSDWKLVDIDNFMQGNSFFYPTDNALETTLKDTVLEATVPVEETSDEFNQLYAKYAKEMTTAETDLASQHAEQSEWFMKYKTFYEEHLEDAFDYKVKLEFDLNREFSKKMLNEIDNTDYTNKIEKLTFGYVIKPIVGVEDKHKKKLDEQIELARFKLKRIEEIEGQRMKATGSKLTPVLHFATVLNGTPHDFDKVNF